MAFTGGNVFQPSVCSCWVILVAAPGVADAFATWTLVWALGSVVVGALAVVVVVTVAGVPPEPPVPEAKVPCWRNTKATIKNRAVTTRARGRFKWSTLGPLRLGGFSGDSLTALNGSGQTPPGVGPILGASTLPVWRSWLAQAICNRQVVGSSPTTGSTPLYEDAPVPFTL